MTSFTKVSGGGNDFIALVEPEAAPDPATTAAWCQRGLSLGADGVFVLRRLGEPRHVRMEHWNSDGGPASLCLNGTRCAARLAFELGWAGAEGVTIETGAGPVRARDAGAAGIALELAPPTERILSIAAEIEGGLVTGWRTVVGVPHLVIEWPETLAEAPVAKLGARLVHHPLAGPDGANVNFVRLVDPHHVEIRTYERGVYAETLACGSGVLSTTQVLTSLGRAAFPLSFLTAGGFALVVDGTLEAGHVHRWNLTGDARIVAQGQLLPGSLANPAPPQWSAR